MNLRFVSSIILVLSAFRPMAAEAQPFRIIWYDHSNELWYPGSIREYLEEQGHTVDYHYIGPTLDISDPAFDDFDVVVAENTRNLAILGLADWLASGRGYVALISGDQYAREENEYIRELLRVDSDGCPLDDAIYSASHSDWEVANFVWVDPLSTIATVPNTDWLPSEISVNSLLNRDHVDLPGGIPIVRDSVSGAVAVVVVENILGGSSGSVAFFGSYFSNDNRSDTETRYLVENLITWVASGGDSDGDGFRSSEGDCDDHDPDINPDADEVCDGVDNDCDDRIDEGFPTTTYFPDDDSDGYGNEGRGEEYCEPPDGWVTRGGDCNDSDPLIRPDASEICDDLDNDCDGRIDEDLPLTTFYADNDDDGFGNDDRAEESCVPISGWVTLAGDCDDDDSFVYPGADELCDEIDNDCDGELDEELVFTNYYTDTDGDGFGVNGTEVSSCIPLDGMSTEPGDCDDGCPNCHPGGVETCDGRDNDCNGLIDDGRSIWTDRDGDGFGDPATEREYCELPPGHAENGDDCDDSNADVNPAATEICNGVDDDCDGEPDDGLVLLYYPDRDGDGFGSSEDGIETCNPSPGMVSDSTDCDDTLFDINPDATELPDGLDNDCDGEVDEGFEGDAGADSDMEQIVRQEGGCHCSFARSSSPMTRWLLWLAPELFTLLNNIGSTSVNG